MIEDVTITLATGDQLTGTAYPIGWHLPEGPGVYIFARKCEPTWKVLYVGEAINLDNRSGKGIKRHEKSNAAIVLGATHVVILTFNVFGAHRRFDLERVLCSQFNPPLNKQLVFG